jgi:hypothetical protein
MKQGIFFAGIENLTLRLTPGRGDSVSNALSQTSDRDFLERNIPAEARGSIGGIEFASLVNGRPVAYSISPLELTSEAEAKKYLLGFLRLVTWFLFHVWFVKDNAAGIEFGYIVWPHDRHIITTRNLLGMVVTDASVAYTAAVRAEMTHDPQTTDSTARVATQVDDQACTFGLRNCEADVARYVDSQRAEEHADAHVAYVCIQPARTHQLIRYYDRSPAFHWILASPELAASWSHQACAP